MLNLHDPKQFAAYQRCLHRAGVGDEIEFYLEEKSPTTSYFYDPYSAAWTSSSYEYDTRQKYYLSTAPTKLTQKFEVIFQAAWQKKGNLWFAPIIAAPNSNILHFVPLTRLIAPEMLKQTESGKYANWYGMEVRALKSAVVAKNIHRKKIV